MSEENKIAEDLKELHRRKDYSGYLVVQGLIERTSAAEERERKLLASLADADTVHANILRGTIALTKAQAVHIAGLPADIEERVRVLREALEKIEQHTIDTVAIRVARAALATPAPETAQQEKENAK